MIDIREVTFFLPNDDDDVVDFLLLILLYELINFCTIRLFSGFYLRHGSLLSVCLSVTVCLSVCLSVRDASPPKLLNRVG